MSDLTVIGSLSIAETQKAVNIAKELWARQTSSDKAATNFVATAKNPILISFNWDELVCTIPMTLNLLGSCIVAASSDTSAELTLTAEKGNFQYLE